MEGLRSEEKAAGRERKLKRCEVRGGGGAGREPKTRKVVGGRREASGRAAKSGEGAGRKRNGWVATKRWQGGGTGMQGLVGGCGKGAQWWSGLQRDGKAEGMERKVSKLSGSGWEASGRAAN